MIRDFIRAWEVRKDDLKKWFMNNPMPQDHAELVKIVFEQMVNPFITNRFYCIKDTFNINNMVVVDHGSYEGTQIYLIPLFVAYPDANDYVVTNDYYGSCSGCDSILQITKYETNPANEKQADMLMSLALGIIQRCRVLGDLWTKSTNNDE